MIIVPVKEGENIESRKRFPIKWDKLRNVNLKKQVL